MILIIDKETEKAEGLSEMFFYMGIPSFAANGREGLSESPPIYKAVILLRPEKFHDIREFALELRSKNPKAPIFAVCDSEGYLSLSRLLFDYIIESPPYAAKIYESISEYAKAHSLPSPDVFKARGVDASLGLRYPTYHTVPIRFTKTESMILRTLISSYPTPLSSKSILKYAFKKKRAPELASIRTHISIMNKKSRDATDKNIIFLSLGKGYTLCDDSGRII